MELWCQSQSVRQHASKTCLYMQYEGKTVFSHDSHIWGNFERYERYEGFTYFVLDLHLIDEAEGIHPLLQLRFGYCLKMAWMQRQKYCLHAESWNGCAVSVCQDNATKQPINFFLSFSRFQVFKGLKNDSQLTHWNCGVFEVLIVFSKTNRQANIKYSGSGLILIAVKPTRLFFWRKWAKIQFWFGILAWIV